jgi:hypothetical protein
MTVPLLNLPINIPWCQVAVTESMMDVRVGADRFPSRRGERWSMGFHGRHARRWPRVSNAQHRR